jgi:hypothetical protein
VQVFHDLLGLFEWFVPRHTKRYAQLGPIIQGAVARYVDEVRRGLFPTEANAFHDAETLGLVNRKDTTDTTKPDELVSADVADAGESRHPSAASPALGVPGVPGRGADSGGGRAPGR